MVQALPSFLTGTLLKEPVWNEDSQIYENPERWDFTKNKIKNNTVGGNENDNIVGKQLR